MLTVRALSESLENLRQLANVDNASNDLQLHQTIIVNDIVATICGKIDSYRQSANSKSTRILEQHINELVSDYLRLLTGETPTTPKYIEDYARTAAETNLPLAALLHLYRIAMQQLLQTTTAALLQSKHQDGVAIVTATNQFLLEFVNHASTHATEQYLDNSRLMADVASDQRGELLAILLGGYDEADRRVSRILRDSGFLDRRLQFCVVLAQSIDPTEMQNPARARRLAVYVDRMLAHLPGKRLIDIHNNKVTLVFAHPQRISGWSPPQTSLASKVAQELMKVGPAARHGISNDVESATQIPSAHRQAVLAFDTSSVGQRVVQFEKIPLQRILIKFAQDEFAQVLPVWADSFFSADDRSHGRLSATLQAYADNSMNLLRTARQLGLHANTVYARFDRIITLTGRDPRNFDELNELLIVAANRVSA